MPLYSSSQQGKIAFRSNSMFLYSNVFCICHFSVFFHEFELFVQRMKQWLLDPFWCVFCCPWYPRCFTEALQNNLALCFRVLTDKFILKNFSKWFTFREVVLHFFPHKYLHGLAFNCIFFFILLKDLTSSLKVLFYFSYWYSLVCDLKTSCLLGSLNTSIWSPVGKISGSAVIGGKATYFQLRW